jgi:NADH-quinone oxidoreductase subunit M
MKGSVMQMICHGISTGALFILVGMIQERIHTRQLTAMGGFWSSAPRMGGIAMVFALASLGLPGLGNFVAEFLVLVGTFQAHPWVATLSASGLVLAAAYSLWLMRSVFFGPTEIRTIPDLSGRETILMAAMTALIVLLGLFPQPVLNAASPVQKLSGSAAITKSFVSVERRLFPDNRESPKQQLASEAQEKDSVR